MKRLGALDDCDGPAILPGYTPADHGRGIVHIGIGAFHRAHQAAITDAALAASGGDWRITGVSLRSGDAARTLSPQNGLYTLIERGVGGTSARVIGAIRDVITADPPATLRALCDPGVRIVTLTVTEKGYGIDLRTGAPDEDHPVVAADLSTPDAPSGTLGLLVAALRKRRAAGVAPFTILSCDNLPDNGALVKSGVMGFARLLKDDATTGLADWIRDNVAFPASMVDRITPAQTPQTLAEAAHQTGCTDLAAIETEPFFQWVIEDHFPTGRPDWEAGGALMVDDVAPYEQMKLTMLNGSHSMLAYVGFLCGKTFVRDVMADQALAALVRRHLGAAASVLRPLPGVDLGAYGAALEDRFRNPEIAHETYQIAMDGSQKMPQRIFQPTLTAIEQQKPLRPFVFATAAWMRYTLGETDTGERYDLRDPRAADIRAVLGGPPSGAKHVVEALCTLPGLIPEPLAQNAGWRDGVCETLDRMLAIGVAKAALTEASG